MTVSVIDFHSLYVGPHWPLSADHHATVAERDRRNRVNRQLASRYALLDEVKSGDLAARVINTPTALFSPLADALAPDTWQRIWVTRDRITALSGRDQIARVEKSIAAHGDWVGDIAIGNWQGFLA